MHQNRASPFASDFCRRRGYRREFAEEIAHLGASKNRDFLGSGKIAAAAAENCAILVHSDLHKNQVCDQTEFGVNPSFGERSRGNTMRDAAFLLTVGSFLLTVELFYLQSSWNFCAYSGKVRLIKGLEGL